MCMLAGHRWQRDHGYRGYRCVGLPLGGVESHQWCVGCNALVGDIEVKDLYGNREISDNIELHCLFDMIASGKGKESVEAGTMGEWKLKIRRGLEDARR